MPREFQEQVVAVPIAVELQGLPYGHYAVDREVAQLTRLDAEVGDGLIAGVDEARDWVQRLGGVLIQQPPSAVLAAEIGQLG